MSTQYNSIHVDGVKNKPTCLIIDGIDCDQVESRIVLASLVKYMKQGSLKIEDKFEKSQGEDSNIKIDF